MDSGTDAVMVIIGETISEARAVGVGEGDGEVGEVLMELISSEVVAEEDEEGSMTGVGEDLMIDKGGVEGGEEMRGGSEEALVTTSEVPVEAAVEVEAEVVEMIAWIGGTLIMSELRTSLRTSRN